MSSSGPAFAWSVATSVMPGIAFSLSKNIGAQWPNSAASASTRVYWYCVRERRAPIVMSCDACMYRVMPCSFASSGLRRLITWSALASRWPRGFSAMNRRPSLSVVVPVAPIWAPTESTAGSFTTVPMTACICFAIA